MKNYSVSMTHKKREGYSEEREREGGRKREGYSEEREREGGREREVYSEEREREEGRERGTQRKEREREEGRERGTQREEREVMKGERGVLTEKRERGLRERAVYSDRRRGGLAGLGDGVVLVEVLQLPVDAAPPVDHTHPYYITCEGPRPHWFSYVLTRLCSPSLVQLRLNEAVFTLIGSATS